MSVRSLTPPRLLEEKDRLVRKLKSEILPLKQQQTSIPLLEHTCRQLLERIRVINQQKSVVDHEHRTRLEATHRNISDLKNQYQKLKSHLRTLGLEQSDLNSDRNGLKNHLEKNNLELEKLRKDADTLFANNQVLIMETNKMLHAEQALIQTNQQINAQIHSLHSQNTDITLKLAEIKGHITQMTADKEHFIDQIKQIEVLNNDMDLQISEKDNVREVQTIDTRKKDEIIKLQLQNMTELESRIKKIKAETAHKATLLRAEQERGIEYTAHIKNHEKCIKDCEQQILKENTACRDIQHENQKAHATNEQIMKDMKLCQIHLQNLLIQNDLLNKQLQGFAQTDEVIKRIIAAKRPIRPLTEYVLKASRNTSH